SEGLGSDVGGTSPRTKSPQPTQWTGSAPVGAPRPTCSRVTTADGRSPGSRVSTLHRLPGIRVPSGLLMEDSPLTVAGAAAGSGGQLPSPHSLFHPKVGAVEWTVENQTKRRQSQRNPPINNRTSRCYSSTAQARATVPIRLKNSLRNVVFFDEIRARGGCR